MRQITIADIHTRLRGLQNLNQSDNNRVFIESAQSAINSNRVSDIKHYIESSIKGNYNVPFYTYLRLFESVIKNGNTSDISSIGTYITENIVHRVRDCKDAGAVLKGRLTRLQNKLVSPISKSMEDMFSSFKRSSAATYSTPVSSLDNDKDRAVAEAYTMIMEKCSIMSHCDRVIENYNKISKRFNLDMLFIENTRVNGVGDTVVDLCNKIDTYNMPTFIKFNTVIETAWYGFESNSIPYKKSEILEAAVDYFLFKPDGLDSCREILESTLFYDKGEDMGNIDVFTEEEPEEPVDESIDESIINTYANRNIIPVDENTSFNDLFNKFKKEELPKTDKPESKIKALINKLYSKNVDSIVEETPDLLQWIRRFFIVGTCAIPAIGPVIMGVTFIADKFISIHKDREELPKMIKCFNNEIKASKTKLKSTEDSEEKQKLEKYIKALEEGRDKLNTYYNKLLTEKEQDARFEEMDDELSDNFFGDDFDFDDFLENSVLGNIGRSINDIVHMNKSNIINHMSMYNLIGRASDDDIVSIANIVTRYPDVFFKESVLNAVIDNISGIRNGKIECDSLLTKSMRLSALDNAKSILESNYESSDDRIYTIYDAASELNSINEAYSAISILIDTYNNRSHLLEASITNTLKVASMKLRSAFTKMSDKERAVSKSIDVGMNNLKKGIERSLTNDNRESIIKGSILPSFSKLIKLCIVNAGIMALGQPAIALIITLGYFALNGKFKAKERQMIIDEIEIELEMCERYINIAESKNDMKALKQLLTTKKELERQRQRIKYKMKVDFGQKYYDSKTP